MLVCLAVRMGINVCVYVRMIVHTDEFVFMPINIYRLVGQALMYSILYVCVY